MTDRELLELAAKAAWITCDAKGPFTSVSRYDLYNGIHTVDLPWNPLTDDGDALRLAVVLDLAVTPYPVYNNPKHSVLVQFKSMDDSRFEVVEMHFEDPCAATRRAIVRAAAEIGKTE